MNFNFNHFAVTDADAAKALKKYIVRSDRNATIESTWFNVSAWEGPNIKDLHLLQKGLWVEVTGRVRIRKYTTQDNEERSSMDILARSVNILPREDVTMQPQRDY